MHFGAKLRTIDANSENIADPAGLMKWFAKDRSTIEFKDAKDIEAKRKALQSLARQWVKYV